MSYCILAEPTISRLEEDVLGLIEEGWEPLGGIAVCVSHYGNIYYHQSMIKRG